MLHELNLFTGFDERESFGWHVFVKSAISRCSCPIAIHPIIREHYAAPSGSNDFTFSRFLIPYIMGYVGWAVYVDGVDMLCRGDLAEFDTLRDPYKAVQVVKHDYKTKHPRKYIGTAMECENLDYERKNWASVMLINCHSMAWRDIRPETLGLIEPLDLLQLKFIPDARIGELPIEWNCLVDETGDDPDARLLHFTTGSPQFEHYANAPCADEWWEVAHQLTES